MKYKTISPSGVPSALKSKRSKPREEKKKTNEKRVRLEKINLGLHQHYNPVNAIGHSMQELVYSVINAIITKRRINSIFGYEIKPRTLSIMKN